MKNIVLAFFFIVTNMAYATCQKPSDLEIMSWSYQAMMATYNMTYENTKESLSLASQYYTKKAWSLYDDALKASGNINRIHDNHFTVTTGIQSSPLILKKTTAYWIVQLPLLINYESTGSYNTEREDTKVNIVQDKNCMLKISKI